MAELDESAIGSLLLPADMVLLVLDEAAHIAPIPDLDQLAATGGSHGLVGVVVYQDLSQARERLGWEKAASIAGCCQCRIITGGIGEPDTIRHFVQLAGDEEVYQTSHTNGAEGRHSTSTAIARRPIADASTFRTVKRGEAIMVYSSYPLARVTLRRSPGKPRP
jgi:type IV secretion system protein VirD4